LPLPTRCSGCYGGHSRTWTHTCCAGCSGTSPPPSWVLSYDSASKNQCTDEGCRSSTEEGYKSKTPFTTTKRDSRSWNYRPFSIATDEGTWLSCTSILTS
jgi:hypothetical protein